MTELTRQEEADPSARYYQDDKAFNSNDAVPLPLRAMQTEGVKDRRGWTLQRRSP